MAQTRNPPAFSMDMTRYNTVPRRYDDTRPVIIQGFAHKKILGIGHELHQKSMEKSEVEKLQAISEAERAVWEQAEQIKLEALEKSKAEAAKEHEKEIKKLKKAYEKKLKEEALQVEMQMQKLAAEQVKEERDQGEKHLKEVIRKTELHYEEEQKKAIAQARADERQKAAEEAAKVANAKYNDLADKTKAPKERVVNKRKLEDEYSKEEGTIHRLHFLSLDAYSRHKMLVNTYLSFYGGSVNQFKRDSSRDKTDMDVIRENHQFLWSDEDDEDELDWGKDLAKKYYNKLFKTYAIVDLSRYKENKIALRWRINQEVVDGKGQFMCGNRKCKESEGLRSWEVNFAYVEHGQKKNALVKLRLCPDCSYKLNYHHRKKEVLPKKKEIKETEKSSKKIRSDELSDDKAESSHSGTIEESDKTKGGSESSIDDESEVWKGPVKLTEEKSREEEFDEYFADMFL